MVGHQPNKIWWPWKSTHMRKCVISLCVQIFMTIQTCMVGADPYPVHFFPSAMWPRCTWNKEFRVWIRLDHTRLDGMKIWTCKELSHFFVCAKFHGHHTSFGCFPRIPFVQIYHMGHPCCTWNKEHRIWICPNHSRSDSHENFHTQGTCSFPCICKVSLFGWCPPITYSQIYHMASHFAHGKKSTGYRSTPTIRGQISMKNYTQKELAHFLAYGKLYGHHTSFSWCPCLPCTQIFHKAPPVTYEKTGTWYGFAPTILDWMAMKGYTCNKPTHFLVCAKFHGPCKYVLDTKYKFTHANKL